MILCNEPWYNEPGRETHLDPTRSRTYNRDRWKDTINTAMISWMTDRLAQPDNEEGHDKGKILDKGKKLARKSWTSKKQTIIAPTQVPTANPTSTQPLKSAPMAPIAKATAMPGDTKSLGPVKASVGSWATAWGPATMLPYALQPQIAPGTPYNAGAAQLSMPGATNTASNTAGPFVESLSGGFSQSAVYYGPPQQAGPSPWGGFTQNPDNLEAPALQVPMHPVQYSGPPQQPVPLPSVLSSAVAYPGWQYHSFTPDWMKAWGNGVGVNGSGSLFGDNPGEQYFLDHDDTGEIWEASDEYARAEPPRTFSNTHTDGKDDDIWGDVIRHHFEKRGQLILNKAKSSSYSTDKTTLKALGETLKKMGFID